MYKLKVFLLETYGFEIHKNLNPKLWDGTTLKPPVREHLLVYAKTWQAFSQIPDEIVKDIIFTGSNANYNYTDTSDIDVHLVIEKDLLGPSQLINDYLANKKSLWTMKHPIKIYGYSVEPYAQDIKEKYQDTQGVFSLKNNIWVQLPVKSNVFDSPDIDEKLFAYEARIDSMIKNEYSPEEFAHPRKEIKNLRVQGLKTPEGEFSEGNLIFKSLRNKGYLEKMNDYLGQKMDRDLTLI